MEKYLIINADDFGMCRAANLATIELFEKGGITSATIMPPCGWAPEAAKFAADNPQYGIGVHLTFTSEWTRYRWSPVNSSNTDSLRDEYGYMYRSGKDIEKNCDLDEVEGEIRAQIERVRKFGLEPSHLDNHMGSIYGIETGRFELLNLIIDIASEYGLPFRFPTNFTDEQYDNKTIDIAAFSKDTIVNLMNSIKSYADDRKVAMVDYLLPGEWNGPQKDSYENFKEYMYEFYKSFPDGITETYIHPSIESEELMGTSTVWLRRVWEHRLFADPATRQHIESLGIKLINYRDLKKMRGF